MTRSLLARIAAFHALPLNDMDPGWHPKAFAAPEEKILWKTIRSERGRYHLHRLALNNLGRGDDPCSDFSDPVRRLALLDRAGLESLIFHAGLALYARDIRTVVLADDRRRLEKNLGSAAYRFALRNASLLNPPPIRERGDRKRLAGPEGPAICKALGQRSITSLWTLLDPPARQRLAWKFPPGTLEVPVPAADVSARTIGRFLVRVVKATMESWRPLFG